MNRNRYIVAYDVRDDYRLRRVYEVVAGFGDRLQYSVYICDLTPRELISMKWKLGEEIKATQDSIVIVDLGPPGERGRSCFEFMGVNPELPVDGEATII